MAKRVIKQLYDEGKAEQAHALELAWAGPAVEGVRGFFRLIGFQIGFQIGFGKNTFSKK